MSTEPISTQVNSTLASSCQHEDQYIIQNPICRQNFGLLPHIYGGSKRKKSKIKSISPKNNRILTLSLPKIQALPIDQNSLKGVSRYLFAGKSKKLVNMSGNFKRSHSIQYSYQCSQDKTATTQSTFNINRKVSLNITRNIDMPAVDFETFKNSLTHRNKTSKIKLHQSIQIIDAKNKLMKITQQNNQLISINMKKIKLKSLNKNILPQMKQIKMSNDVLIKKCETKFSQFEQIKQQNQQNSSQPISPSKTKLTNYVNLTQESAVSNKKMDLKDFNLQISALQNSNNMYKNKKQTMFYSLQKRYQSKLNTCKNSRTSSRIDEQFIKIPAKQEYKQFIKSYKSINKQFNLSQISKKPTFSIIVKNKSVYFGQINEQNRKNGFGLTLTENSLFQGEYLNNLKFKGCQKNRQGTYIGGYQNGQRSGIGQFIWINGQFFKGQWANGKKNGFGMWRSPEGHSYQGQWIENRQQGKGIFIHFTSTYEGQFLNFYKHGHGKQIFKNGDKYIGEYKNGKPQGKGRYEWSNGVIYQGEFKQGKRDGFGIQTDENGNFYQGEFKQDQRKIKCSQNQLLSLDSEADQRN